MTGMGGFVPTPAEQAVMDQNMAHARVAARSLIARAGALVDDGIHGEDLRDKVLDLVLAEARPRYWPGRRITEEVALIAMLIEAVIETAAGTAPR